MSLLSVSNLTAGYGGSSVLHQVDFDVKEDQLVSIIGPNGAGKTTLFETIYGYVSPSSGMIEYKGQDITGLNPEQIATLDIVYIPQGTTVFKNMTTKDNLRMGAYQDGCELSEDEERVFEIFPILSDRKNQKAGTLSGGEQQMLEIARGLVAGNMNPDLLLMDEPSTGLAPIILKEVVESIEEIKELGTDIVLVEQRAKLALDLSDYTYVLENGQIKHHGPSDDIKKMPEIQNKYSSD